MGGCSNFSQSRMPAADLLSRTVWWGYDWCRPFSFCRAIIECLSSFCFSQPIRFQHIATTVQTSLKSLLKLVQLRDLRQALDALDEEIASLRAQSTDRASSQTGPGPSLVSGNGNKNNEQGKYDSIQDVTKLQRLVSAKEKTVAVLLKKQNSTSA